MEKATMKNIKRKFRIIEELRDSIDDYIWKIFTRYIRLCKINFNSPDDWSVEDDHIHFHGSDGCMGCYDNMSISIPTKFFIDPEAEFEILEKEFKKDLEQKKSREKQNKKRQQHAELKILKEKYESKK
jgi:hypothetical protein